MLNNHAAIPSAVKPKKIGVSDDNRLDWQMPKVSVAPMMDWTDRHCRYFLRGFSPKVLLYTEMLTAEALLHGDHDRLLRFHTDEHPLALQLGGADPQRLAAAARLGHAAGYDEINLNCGCPSDRVHAGAFGACLMLDAARVAECVAAMRQVVPVPVTVKLRIGVVVGSGAEARACAANFEEQDWDALCRFTVQMIDAGCDALIVHARKAVLGGLSPQQNREVPPLRPDIVRRLKAEFPALPMVLNGGLRTVQQVHDALQWCDGVMLGREAYHRPQVLGEIHRELYADGWNLPTAAAMLQRMARYADEQLRDGARLASIVRHMLGLLAGRSGARQFRRMLSEGARDRGVGAELLIKVAEQLPAPL